MSMKNYRYPDNWDEIATSIKERAGWVCEQCGAIHDAYITRDPHDPAKFRYITDGDLLDEHLKITRVMLTVHHIGVQKPDGSPGDMHDKLDCRSENLIALCQRCHLLADLPDHIALAKQTRINRKHERQLEAGQQILFD